MHVWQGHCFQELPSGVDDMLNDSSFPEGT